jgi:hypothetical protein
MVDLAISIAAFLFLCAVACAAIFVVLAAWIWLKDNFSLLEEGLIALATWALLVTLAVAGVLTCANAAQATTEIAIYSDGRTTHLELSPTVDVGTGIASIDWSLSAQGVLREGVVDDVERIETVLVSGDPDNPFTQPIYENRVAHTGPFEWTQYLHIYQEEGYQDGTRTFYVQDDLSVVAQFHYSLDTVSTAAYEGDFTSSWDRFGDMLVTYELQYDITGALLAETVSSVELRHLWGSEFRNPTFEGVEPVDIPTDFEWSGYHYTVIPEPGPALLMGLGLVGLAIGGRR